MMTERRPGCRAPVWCLRRARAARGDREGEGGAGRRVVAGEGAGVLAGDPSRDGEAQAGARAGVVEPHEAVEDAVTLAGRHARPVVYDAGDHVALGAVQLDADGARGV